MANEYRPLLLQTPQSSSVRTGDVISPHRAVLTLAKSMFNAGCFSLPYAWKLGGLWASFALSFVIAVFNWYGNHILARSSQHLAKITHRPSLDYGHFTKKACDYSTTPILRRNSKTAMYIVNVTILFYQLGMCSVAILFMSDNLEKIVYDWTGYDASLVTIASIVLVFVVATNMYTEMRVISVFAMISTVFFLLGAVVILQYAIRQPNQYRALPASADFKSTVMFFGIAMYAFEGQTMILPIENKLRTPHDFLNNCGVLPTTMLLCTLFMVAIGFYGYTGFGTDIKQTITLNMPNESFYVTVNIFLIMQSMLGHSIAMYVVFDMFFNGFRRKFILHYPTASPFWIDKGFRTFWVIVTYLMAILIPKLDIMIPLVGVTSGTLCALVYPPILEMIIFWKEWHHTLTTTEKCLKIGINLILIFIGLFAICAGVYANVYAIIVAFSQSNPYAGQEFPTTPSSP